MRRCYLVCYDIRNPKRLRRVHKTLKGYGEAVQFSVFFCVLKDIDRVRLQSDLEKQMNLNEDQTLILDLGPNEEEARQALTVIGKALPDQNPGTIVVV
ncbi:CRISPR-associated endonuclease Cas2 [Thermomonas hydrothermalis]|uniref:CRISPR-associated endoribonuclease Cas2 n=1 Tax=Thermomonas hydrothermalis TaxID=213588 RepID=A0A1M4ST66_9GAMM|nr:CRISPR-associated endonuclease Cas2 [Thermomonas hydrothermalis]MCL6619765.1 CRISPR-associated endonuclease Cas2 [Thermomonas hydrothermalis]SHE35444.1 CRISPR-associated protein Cas2 [Thermomonas hydrothermalis]